MKNSSQALVHPTRPVLRPNDTDSPSLTELEQQARHCYEQSQSNRTSNEHTVQFRGQARALAQRMLDMAPNHAPALNLLGRIALDEGFYDSADSLLQQALDNNSHDAGVCFSLGHVKLAQRQYDAAIRLFTRALDIAPGETRAATSLVYTFARQGRMTQAFSGYRKLFRVHPDDAHVRAQLFEVARHIQADCYQPELAADVIEWLKLDNVDHEGLARLTSSLLKHKYQLDDPDAVIDLQDLARDELLQLALSRLYFSNAELEGFLTLVRKQVLLHSLAGQFSDTQLLRLAAAFCMQGAHNEYVYNIDDEEQPLVAALRDLLHSTLASSADLQPNDVLSALLMYGMYEPVSDIAASERLLNIASNRWPSYARPVISHCLAGPQGEIREAQSIERLTPIADAVSLKVQAQYEESPYPRWLHLGYNTPTNYGRALEAELEHYRAPQFFNMGTIKVLVAGAGTGRHALRIAKYFRNVEVTAIDLSARSLAYAQRMAKRHHLRNIRFLQADILHLDQLNERFHVIECSGVLHHMANPQAGLAALLPKLEDKGVMKIGLYSEAARQRVVQARRWIEQLGYDTTRADIRRFRANLMAERFGGDVSGLLESPDFYSTSGCRDLLFHVQEHRFTPSQIDALLNRHALQFLGFVLPQDIRQQFGSQTHCDLTDLNAWQRFEQSRPDTFAGMYQFFVQRAL
ncbi:class I SAM-dependent methyltransferase [Saccharospirillum mangrovi]|uniref:class I SAM-dependent methyltransferase n=1 Tax=Saccharospirillum mangrovi TaxID=2161747 RepID=UPI000D39AD7E|nr:class I SAM-dependent methyltransferase [Saccharospirillum mangrovi]